MTIQNKTTKWVIQRNSQNNYVLYEKTSTEGRFLPRCEPTTLDHAWEIMHALDAVMSNGNNM